MSRALTNGAGLEIINPDFGAIGLLALRTVFKLPPRLRETLLFGPSKLCMPLQKVLIRLLGGAFLVQTRFTEGPMSGQSFTCWTSEKYFMLGSHMESEVQNLFSKMLYPGDTIYDVGGHAGYMSLLFSAIVGPSGRVFTFEPSPVNFVRVRGNIEANARCNVTVLNVAASDHEGVAAFNECGSMSSIVETAEAPSIGTSQIRTMRLDDFVYRDGNPSPAFVKLDVEGHAGPALEGMLRTLESSRPKIICELHNSEEEEHVTRILSAHRYSSYPIDREQGFPRRIMISPE